MESQTLSCILFFSNTKVIYHLVLKQDAVFGSDSNLYSVFHMKTLTPSLFQMGKQPF